MCVESVVRPISYQSEFHVTISLLSEAMWLSQIGSNQPIPSLQWPDPLQSALVGSSAMGTPSALRDAYCVDTSGTPFATSWQCSRLLLAQALQVVFLALCMRRVLALSSARYVRVQHRTTYQTMLALVRSLIVGVAALASGALAVAASPLHSTASLVISGWLSGSSWFFYFVAGWLERSRHVSPSLAILASQVAFVLIEWSQLSLGLSPTADDRIHTVLFLQHTRVLSEAAATSLSLIVVSLASPTNDATKAPRTPFDEASFLSRMFYHWVTPFVYLGKRRRLELDDVPPLSSQDTTANAARRFQSALQSELQRSPAEASFLRLLRRLYGREILGFALWSAANKVIGLASPLLIKLFLDWADTKPSPELSRGYFLAFCMVLRSFLAATSGTQYSLVWKRFELRVRAGLTAAIYDRTLRIIPSHHVEGIGHISNLVSVDVGRLVGMPGSFFDMFLIPIEIVFSLALLAHEVKYAFTGGVIVLACMLPIQTLLGGKIQAVTKQMLAFRDKRIEITAEALKSMRTIKLLAWIDVYFEKIDAYRRLEMAQLSIRKYLDAFCVFFWASTPVIVQTSVFVLVIYTGHDLTAANAFTAVSLLDRLIYPMNYFPWIINGFLEARVSALRIRRFLFNSSIASRCVPGADGAMIDETGQTNVVGANGCEYYWITSEVADDGEDITKPFLGADSGHFVLRIANVELKQGSTYVVCGSVGSGKSSFLLALLGEMTRVCGYQSVACSRIAYAPQTPWLFRGTVRENITMSQVRSPIDEALYRRVLRVCDLEQDLASRKEGDLSAVSENGTNLSGGQKIRINLARALYERTKLYLLDDPLSGVDPKTARKILTNCFQNDIFPENSTVIVTTHAVDMIESFPPSVEVLVLSDGQLVEQGLFTYLKDATSGPFASMRQSSPVYSGGAVHVSTTSDQPHDHGDSEGETNTSEVSASEDEEHRESGTVQLRVWIRYAAAIGWPLALSIIVSITIMQVSRNGIDWWIAFYTNDNSVSPRYFANVLLWITLVNCISVFFRAFLFAYGGLQAAKTIYSALVSRIFGAPLHFFDQTPSGRIINRLNGDTYSVDESLPFILNIFLKDFADVTGTLVVIFYGNKFVLLLLVPLSVIYFHLQASYRPLSRHVQRLESTTQSPILSMFTETLEGLNVIRAMKLQSPYRRAYEERLSANQRVSFLGANAGSWFGIRLDMLGVCVTSFVAVFAVIEFQWSGVVHPGMLGLTLTYALPVVSKLNAILGSFVDTERQMIAVERVKEYGDLQPEEQVRPSAGSQLVPPAWPVRGEIEVCNLSVSYGGQDFKPVRALRNVSCTFEAGEKIGICGRTGAGKTTFMHALFRAVPWTPGSTIRIDGVAVDQVPLQFLRSRLTYVPQDVVLFSGTVRSNLDPEEKAADHELWACLARCSLDTVIARMPGGLEARLQSSESSLSKGQAQLLCITRALLRRSRILCIDEATSSIDYETESVISKTLDDDFADATVIIIAHRLNTIANCDRVLLFDEGSVVESGPPRDLLSDANSRFNALAGRVGI